MRMFKLPKTVKPYKGCKRVQSCFKKRPCCLCKRKYNSFSLQFIFLSEQPFYGNYPT